ncbi:MAG: MBL fold metallo-hydrolase [Proteobacteria bacterium]|nr:MBL fold metallo-hydrolase [Pseudomonadota bacterium]
MRVTILGCGAAQGMPVWGLEWGKGWGACDPLNSKNRRTRASIFIESDGTSLLVDTSPDLKDQGFNNNITNIDAVLFTHAHADHCHGINDLQFLARAWERLIPVYASHKTIEVLKDRFNYAFQTPQSAAPHHGAFLIPHQITESFKVKNVTVIPFEQDHGFEISLGFRVKDFAYSTDVVQLNDKAFEVLKDVDTWVVDCLRYESNLTHAHLPLVLEWIERVGPRRAILTHLNFEMDYEELSKKLPSHVEVAYDGMVLEI